jgi:superfamily II DNA or RNA helicase
MQRIGRILRPFEGKETATAIDFRIHQKYLFEHSVQREKMYRTEEEYDIEEIDPDESSQ